MGTPTLDHGTLKTNVGRFCNLSYGHLQSGEKLFQCVVSLCDMEDKKQKKQATDWLFQFMPYVVRNHSDYSYFMASEECKRFAQLIIDSEHELTTEIWYFILAMNLPPMLLKAILFRKNMPKRIFELCMGVNINEENFNTAHLPANVLSVLITSNSPTRSRGDHPAQFIRFVKNHRRSLKSRIEHYDDVMRDYKREVILGNITSR